MAELVEHRHDVVVLHQPGAGRPSRPAGIRRREVADQHALGELLTCPFCTAVWVASGLAAGLVFAPRLTRFGMGVASAIAGADFLHLGYGAAKRVANG